MRQLFLLNGLAIFAVVCNHAAHAGFLPMFWWTNRYLPVSDIPNFDQIATLAYYAILIIIILTNCAVPIFFFVSGYFIAYAAKGKNSVLSWKFIETRLVYLLIPCVIWTLVIFFL